MMSSVAYFLALALVVGQAETPASEQPNVFELPRLQARLDGLQVQLQTALQSRKFADAEGLCREMIKLAPHEPLPHYNLACTLARQQLPDAANAALAEAVARGFNDVKHLEADADLAPLRDRDDFKKLLEKAANAKPDQQTG